MDNLTNTNPLIWPQEVNGSWMDVSKIGAKARVINYCLYARKSSEDDERQALSIDSQIKEMGIQAETQGLRVIEIRKESHSAKESGQRPVFNQLIEDIREGLFQGILSWSPDRLSRNAGDLGTLVDLMDRGLLKEIRTHGQYFTNSPNDKFLLMILCSQAKLENDNRGINVKRGQKTKCELGVRPNFAPLGYLNDYYSGKGLKKIFVDQERAPFIKQSFEKVAYEDFSGRDVYHWLKSIDFKTRKGKHVTLSMIYRMLNNPYYCGMFQYGENWYKGTYEPIVSKELFDEVQAKLTVHPKTKPGTKEFDFTKMMKCGSCGSGITAEERIKRRSTGIRRYVYYHCTRSRDLKCPEVFITEEDLIQEFIQILDKVSLDQIQTQEKLNQELERYKKFSSIFNTNNDLEDQEVDIQKFIEYIFKEGSRDDKRELLNSLQTTLYLKDRKITTQI